MSASRSGGEGRLLHGGLAGQELLEDGVHLAADHLLDRGRMKITTSSKKKHRKMNAKQHQFIVQFPKIIIEFIVI